MGEKLFRTWEFPRSGSKAKNGGGKKEKKERLNDGDNNGQATHGHASTHGARKPPGPKIEITPYFEPLKKIGQLFAGLISTLGSIRPVGLIT